MTRSVRHAITHTVVFRQTSVKLQRFPAPGDRIGLPLRLRKQLRLRQPLALPDAQAIALGEEA